VSRLAIIVDGQFCWSNYDVPVCKKKKCVLKMEQINSKIRWYILTCDCK